MILELKEKPDDANNKVARPNLLRRIRASLVDPLLVGESGTRKRYLKVQWWVVFWRLLILVLIVEVALVNPSDFTSVPYALLVLLMALAYTFIYGYLATRTRAAGTRRLYLLDLAVCAGLMFLAHDDKLIFIMSFYSYSSLLSRPTVNFREALPATVFLSLAFLGANQSVGYDVPDQLTSPFELGSFILYYFWGLGFVGFSAVLARASSLELDTLLDQQRKKYRRRLHDELGNTLCGLHYKIQSLGQADRSGELEESLDYLSAGYERADKVMRRLLAGLEEQESGEFAGSLQRLAAGIGEESGLAIKLELPRGQVNLSPEVQREVFAIVREAAMNAARHAGVDTVSIKASIRGGSLRVEVADWGAGFSEAQLQDRQEQGSLGIRGMRERAKLVQGALTIDSAPGRGTSLVLEVRTLRRSRFFGRVLDYEPGRDRGGVYPFLIRLRAFMFAWTIINLLMQPAGREFSLPLIVILAVLTVDCLVWVVFSSSIYRLLTGRPWLILFEQLVFVGIFFITAQSGLPFFYPLYLGVAIIVDGLFLGTLGNLGMVMVLNAGILIAHVTTTSPALGVTLGARLEAALQHVTIFTIIAVSAGLAGEFIDSLEGLQIQAIRRALARQRERLAAETHRNLYSLIGKLNDEIRTMAIAAGTGSDVPLGREPSLKIEEQSTNLKTSLRSMMKSLDYSGNSGIESSSSVITDPGGP